MYSFWLQIDLSSIEINESPLELYLFNWIHVSFAKLHLFTDTFNIFKYLQRLLEWRVVKEFCW